MKLPKYILDRHCKTCQMELKARIAEGHTMGYMACCCDDSCAWAQQICLTACGTNKKMKVQHD